MDRCGSSCDVTGSGLTSEPAGERLQPRPDPQETNVTLLQQPQHQRMKRRESERAKQRNCTPHGSEGSGTGQQLPVLLRMELGEQLGPVQRARRFVVRCVDELDVAAPIQLPHQLDLAAAEGARSIVPDDNGFHPADVAWTALRTMVPDRRYFFGFGGAAAAPFMLGCEAFGFGGCAFFGLPLLSFISSSPSGVRVAAGS